MADASHAWGADLEVGPTGDILVADGEDLVRQRVTKRLLTNPGDYIWALDYGAGVGRFVGQPVRAEQIAAVVRAQVLLEETVARQPEPVVAIQSYPGGTVILTVRYADAATGEARVLSLP